MQKRRNANIPQRETTTLIDAKSIAFQLESSNQTTRPLGQHAAVVVVVEDTSFPAMRWLGLVRCSPCLSYNFSPSTSLVSFKLVVFFFHVLPNFGYKHKWIWGGFSHSETSWVTFQTHLRMNAKTLVFDGRMHLVPSRPQLFLPGIPKRKLEDPRSAVIILKLTVLIPSWLPKLVQLCSARVWHALSILCSFPPASHGQDGHTLRLMEHFQKFVGPHHWTGCRGRTQHTCSGWFTAWHEAVGRGCCLLATESAKDSFCRLPSVPSVYLILGAKSIQISITMFELSWSEDDYECSSKCIGFKLVSSLKFLSQVHMKRIPNFNAAYFNGFRVVQYALTFK